MRGIFPNLPKYELALSRNLCFHQLWVGMGCYIHSKRECIARVMSVDGRIQAVNGPSNKRARLRNEDIRAIIITRTISGLSPDLSLVQHVRVRCRSFISLSLRSKAKPTRYFKAFASRSKEEVQQ